MDSKEPFVSVAEPCFLKNLNFYCFKLILFWCFWIVLIADVKTNLKIKKYYFNIFWSKRYIEKQPLPHCHTLPKKIFIIQLHMRHTSKKKNAFVLLDNMWTSIRCDHFRFGLVFDKKKILIKPIIYIYIYIYIEREREREREREKEHDLDKN
jgi:hypothetical protein